MLGTLVLACASNLAIELRDPVERGWAALIESRAASWRREVPALAIPFAPICGPQVVRVVVTDQGEDAFTPDPKTIQFNAARLLTLYGQPGMENTDRIDRFFRHEYTHLLQKAWLAEHPYRAETPFRRTLAEIWAEGLGNYYSLSPRWRRTSLRRRVAGTRRTGTGALPAALWLEAEVFASPDALRRFVTAGPDGVWDLADRHLPDPLRRVLAEHRERNGEIERREIPERVRCHLRRSNGKERCIDSAVSHGGDTCVSVCTAPEPGHDDCERGQERGMREQPGFLKQRPARAIGSRGRR